jgi:hypothetical protein
MLGEPTLTEAKLYEIEGKKFINNLDVLRSKIQEQQYMHRLSTLLRRLPPWSMIELTALEVSRWDDHGSIRKVSAREAGLKQ